MSSKRFFERPILAGPLFRWAKFWLGQFYWLGFIAGPFLAGLMAWSLIDPAKSLVQQKLAQPKIGPAIIGPANFFFTLAGPFFDWAKNGCSWPSQHLFTVKNVNRTITTFLPLILRRKSYKKHSFEKSVSPISEIL